MDTERISRKILAPAVAPTILHREGLVQVLGNALRPSDPDDPSVPYHLVLLCAPAGYGKTTLLADTMKHLSLTCCWYFLDRSDLDVMAFLAMLLTSIRRHFPSFGPELDTLLLEVSEQNNNAYQLFLDALINALATDISERSVLAFCNYQEVNDSRAINNILNQLLKHLSPHHLIVIESRAVPNLELATLIANRKMFGLGSSGLQFSAKDLYALAQIQGLLNFSEEEATRLVTTFHGWITGILLSSRLGSAQFEQFSSAHSSNWATPAIAPNRQQLFAFVITDIFRTEPTIYDFLKNTSPLDQLSPSLCDALLETSNAAFILEHAERHGLFVLRISERNEKNEPIYQCHPTLRELFQEELRRHEGEKYRALHQQIATLSFQRHAFEVALNHAFEAQHYDFAAQILLDMASTVLNRGQSETILRFLERFPSQFMQGNARLLLLRVRIALRRGDFANANLLLEPLNGLVMSSFPEDENKERVLIHVEFTIATGQIFLHQGEHQRAQQHFRLALELLPINEHVLRIQAYQQLGICLILGGNPIREGVRQFQQALCLCHPQRDERLAGELHHQLANAYEWSGNYTIAEHHRQHILALQDRLGQPQSIINNLTGMGILKMRQGLVEEAETFFRTTLELTQESPRLLSSKAYALQALGELEMTCQRWKETLAHLEEALALARQLEDRYLLNGVLHTLALVYLRMGETYTSQCLLDQISLHMQEIHSYESVLHQLVQGTILLTKQEYDQAKARFAEVAQFAEQAELQWLRMQALMRMAACCLEQGQRTQAKDALQQVRTLNTNGNYEYGIQVEIQTYPKLHLLMQGLIEQKSLIDLQFLPQTTLRISALGEPVVVIDTMPITRWRMARAMELYFFLLDSGQPLRKDQIITALWPESDDIERANQTFRSTVYYVRQVMGEIALVQRSGLYWLDLHAMYGSFWYDVTIFEEQQRIAQTALEEEDDECAAQAFQKMVTLYRDDYVKAFYNDWCIRHRDILREAFLEAHHQLALIAWRSEKWDESLLHWQHLLTIDPYLETAHYGIMRCYLRQGRRNLALRQYQRCSRELHEQLNIKPGLQLQKLYHRLTNNEA